MGNHTTSIYNDTNDDIVVIITDNDSRNSQVNMRAKDIKHVPTCMGRVTISCFIGQTGNKTNSCVYTDDSNRGFIIEKQGERLSIVRANFKNEIEFERDEGPRYFSSNFRKRKFLSFFFK